MDNLERFQNLEHDLEGREPKKLQKSKQTTTKQQKSLSIHHFTHKFTCLMLNLTVHSCYCLYISGVYIHRATYRSYTKLTGHLTTSKQNEWDILHHRSHCCISVQLHLSVMIHASHKQLSKKETLNNESTNKKSCKTIKKKYKSTMNE